MQFIQPNVVRVIVPRGTRLYYSNAEGRPAVVLAVDTAVDVEIDESSLGALAARACGNKSRRACDGPLTAKPIGKPLTETRERVL